VQQVVRPLPLLLLLLLSPLLQALRCEVLARPGLLGGSAFGLDDVARLLHPFLRRFRAAQAADPGLKPYIISADVRKAFDSGGVEYWCW
jgi:hypothetical protein